MYLAPEERLPTKRLYGLTSARARVLGNQLKGHRPALGDTGQQPREVPTYAHPIAYLESRTRRVLVRKVFVLYLRHPRRAPAGCGACGTIAATDNEQKESDWTAQKETVFHRASHLEGELHRFNHIKFWRANEL